MIGVDPHELGDIMRAIFPIESFPQAVQAKVRRARVKALRRAVLDRLCNGIYYGSVICIAGWLLAQAVDRTPPSRVAMALLTPKVAPGGDIKFRLTLDRLRPCWVTVSWIISDGHHEVRPYSEDPIPPTADPPLARDPIRSFPLWADAAPGQGRIRITRSYVCPGNYLHQFNPIVVTSPTFAFEIVPPA